MDRLYPTIRHVVEVDTCHDCQRFLDNGWILLNTARAEQALGHIKYALGCPEKASDRTDAMKKFV